MNITRISLKHTTENIQIPDWAKTIVIHADTTAPYSEKKLQQIYGLFFKTLGITDESRTKYTLRFHVRFDRPDSDYYVEFADMIINDRVRVLTMPRNKKPRKKFTCRKIEIPRISEERIDVIIDTMTNVGFSVELKLPYGKFDRDDMRALADFSNLTGVTFNELGEIGE